MGKMKDLAVKAMEEAEGMGRYVVFTGPAFDAAGNGIVRADLVAEAQARHFSVQKQVDARTQLVVASRMDTVKAKKAAECGLLVITYPEFIAMLGGKVAASTGEYDPFVDGVPVETVKEPVKADPPKIMQLLLGLAKPQ